MKCPDCQFDMVPLFTSVICERCDKFGKPIVNDRVGYITHTHDLAMSTTTGLVGDGAFAVRTLEMAKKHREYGQQSGNTRQVMITSIMYSRPFDWEEFSFNYNGTAYNFEVSKDKNFPIYETNTVVPRDVELYAHILQVGVA